jgi:hypothetical protein
VLELPRDASLTNVPLPLPPDLKKILYTQKYRGSLPVRWCILLINSWSVGALYVPKQGPYP